MGFPLFQVIIITFCNFKEKFFIILVLEQSQLFPVYITVMCKKKFITLLLKNCLVLICQLLTTKKTMK